jgi:hypothetical protein
MAQTIQIKRSHNNDTVPTLNHGEFAYLHTGTSGNEGKLFIGRPGTTAGNEINDIVGGKIYVDKLNTVEENAEVNPQQASNTELLQGTYTSLRSYSPADIVTMIDEHGGEVYTGGTGVTISGSNVVSIGQSVATTASPTFASGTFTGNVILGNADSDSHTVNGSLDITDSLTANDAPFNIGTAGQNSTINGYLTVSQNSTFQNDLSVGGNLTVNGTMTTVNTEEINLADNIINLNSNLGSNNPTQDGGISINRGNYVDVQLYWSESNNQWEVTSHGDTGTGTATSSVLITTGNSSTATYTLDGGTF